MLSGFARAPDPNLVCSLQTPVAQLWDRCKLGAVFNMHGFGLPPLALPWLVHPRTQINLNLSPSSPTSQQDCLVQNTSHRHLHGLHGLDCKGADARKATLGRTENCLVVQLRTVTRVTLVTRTCDILCQTANLINLLNLPSLRVPSQIILCTRSAL